MGRSLLLLAAAATLFAADDPWTKVKDLKSGAEIHVLCRGAKPLEAKLDRATDDAIVVRVKNGQRSIAKDEIDRLDYRPEGREVTSELQRGMKPPAGATEAVTNRPQEGVTGGVKFSKRPYETIYRRPRA